MLYTIDTLQIQKHEQVEREWKTIYHAKGMKRAGVTILTSNKIELKTKIVIKGFPGLLSHLSVCLQAKS